MVLGVDSSGNGMAEGFGFGETVFFEDGLSRRRFDVCEESNGGVFVGGSFQDDERLEKRCVLFLRNFPRVAGGEGRRGCNGSGKDADFGVAGLNELGRLGNIFTKDEFRFYFFVEAGGFEGFDGGAAIGCVIGIGDGDFLDGGIEKRLPAGFLRIEFGVGGRPEDESTNGVRIGGVGEDETGHVEFVRVIAVGGEEDVEGGAVLDLREEVAAGAEGEIYFDVGLFFIGGGEVG